MRPPLTHTHTHMPNKCKSNDRAECLGAKKIRAKTDHSCLSRTKCADERAQNRSASDQFTTFLAQHGRANVQARALGAINARSFGIECGFVYEYECGRWIWPKKEVEIAAKTKWEVNGRKTIRTHVEWPHTKRRHSKEPNRAKLLGHLCGELCAPRATLDTKVAFLGHIWDCWWMWRWCLNEYRDRFHEPLPPLERWNRWLHVLGAVERAVIVAPNALTHAQSTRTHSMHAYGGTGSRASDRSSRWKTG